MRRASRSGVRGFSLIETAITLMVLSVIMGALMLALQTSASSRVRTLNAIDARQKASMAMARLCKDLRMAGTDVDASYATPQPAIAYIDSLEVIISGDFSGGRIAPIDTLAYDPTGAPKPNKLTGAYAPPIKYRTGAELVRWTLDVNNDGHVNGADNANANGVAAKRTRNPKDFTLVRQVYGDSLNDIAHDNGGAMAWIAPILKPGSGVPPIYTVTMKDGSTWDWSSGAVPAAQLRNIASVKVQITAESASPDGRGRYVRILRSTQVNVTRITS